MKFGYLIKRAKSMNFGQLKMKLKEVHRTDGIGIFPEFEKAMRKR